MSVLECIRGVDGYLRHRSPVRDVYSRRIRPAAVKAAIRLELDRLATSEPSWWSRINDVLEAPDNEHIPRVADAGRVGDGYQVMHNGIRIVPHCYNGIAVQMMLELNRGVHEPQEERVFAEVLPYIRPGGVMIELGSYWGFYSLWFHSRVDDASCYLVEPDPEHLRAGERNFALNGMRGTFIEGFVGAGPARLEGGGRVVGVDELVDEYGIDRVDILHSDIQGYELDMLEGSRRSLASGKVDFVFISTHSNEIHAGCREFLGREGFEILASSDLDQSYSVDGLLVARAPHAVGPGPVPIALRGVSGGSKV